MSFVSILGYVAHGFSGFSARAAFSRESATV